VVLNEAKENSIFVGHTKKQLKLSSFKINYFSCGRSSLGMHAKQ
jgi:hypothetical protein